MIRTQITNVNKKNVAGTVLTEKNAPLTAVGLFLIRLVLAVGHPITGQAVVDTVAVSTLKVIHTST